MDSFRCRAGHCSTGDGRTHALVAAIYLRGFRQGHGQRRGTSKRRVNFFLLLSSLNLPTQASPTSLQIKADSKGNLYAAGGSNAKVIRIDASGRSTGVFESPELTAQALAVDGVGNLFVGTSPDGKVFYKVTPDGKSSVFFDPRNEIHLGSGH